MGIEKVVNISISRQTAGVTQAGFGIPLILGPNKANANVGTYTTLAAVAEDFSTSDAEYLMAQKIFSQTPRPPVIKIAKTSTEVAQVNILTPDVTVQAIAHFIVTIDGVDYDFTSDIDPTATEVVTGLKALINADADCPVDATGATTLILTAKQSGVPFTIEASANLDNVENTANVGIATDILSVVDKDNTWYFLELTSKTEHVVLEAAKTIEAMTKLLIVRNDDAAGRTAATDDLLSQLKALNYFRTAVMYHTKPTQYADAGLVGRCAPLPPGSETWAYKTIAGVEADQFTDGEINNLDTKNANYYITMGGISVTVNGKVSGGEYIDIIRFIDWLQARMAERIYGTITSVDKIPYTDGGITVVENDMRAVLEAGVKAGGIASSQDYTITVPKAIEISPADKAARRLTGLKFTAKLAGAIHAVEITGNVTL